MTTNTKHIRNGYQVEFSDTGMICVMGEWYSPFTRNSWSCRVTKLDTGSTYYIVMPVGARERGKTELVTLAIKTAESLGAYVYSAVARG